MWASPPFLHNGSVPNLYELLLPAKERSKTFFIGREFDPMKVGVDTTGESGRFLFDTSLIGNSNAGHSFENGSGRGIIGRLLNDENDGPSSNTSNRYLPRLGKSRRTAAQRIRSRLGRIQHSLTSETPAAITARLS